MRNILITAMMLVVVVLLFVNIVFASGGIKSQIESKGRDAINQLSGLNLLPSSNP